MREELDASRAEIHRILERNPDSVFAALALAVAEAMSGRRDAALGALDRAAEAAGPDRFDFGPRVEKIRARVLTLLGDRDAAVALIEDLLSLDCADPLTVHLLRLDPVWDPLRDHPRFRELVAER